MKVFTENNSLWKGISLNLDVKEVLYHKKSKYQDVLVFESTTFGTVLVLDGVIQVTTRDEFAYQECIAHIPLCAHPNPEKVLVIGGGDGAVLREVVKHPNVKSVTLVEIDEDVIKVSKDFLPSLACGFEHEKVTVHVGDGFEYLNNHQDEFDVIITDSSDPEGPAEALFGMDYFKLLHRSVKKDGIVITQAESIWLHLDLIKSIHESAKTLFGSVQYAMCSIPTYPSGTIGFLVCSKEGRDCSKPVRKVDQCRYYDDATHSAAFVLPVFARKALSQ